MAENIEIKTIKLDDQMHPTVSVTKRLEDFEILGTARIMCAKHPSLTHGISDYVDRHVGEWGLQSGEAIGVLRKGKEGLYGLDYSQKTVVFYRIRDSLD